MYKYLSKIYYDSNSINDVYKILWDKVLETAWS